MNREQKICSHCLNFFSPHFEKFKIDDVSALTLFYYDVFMKDLIYKFKGCYDYELKDLFLNMYKRELSLLYSGYEMIPAPSYIEDDKKRGYNHVIEIFKNLKLKINEAFLKTEKFKQADNNFKNRKKIKKYIKLKEDVVLGKKILLVDDVKGLEFEKVYVYPLGMEKEEEYLASSRALRHLVILKDE